MSVSSSISSTTGLTQSSSISSNTSQQLNQLQQDFAKLVASLQTITQPATTSQSGTTQGTSSSNGTSAASSSSTGTLVDFEKDLASLLDVLRSSTMNSSQSGLQASTGSTSGTSAVSSTQANSQSTAAQAYTPLPSYGSMDASVGQGWTADSTYVDSTSGQKMGAMKYTPAMQDIYTRLGIAGDYGDANEGQRQALTGLISTIDQSGTLSTKAQWDAALSSSNPIGALQQAARSSLGTLGTKSWTEDGISYSALTSNGQKIGSSFVPGAGSNQAALAQEALKFGLTSAEAQQYLGVDTTQPVVANQSYQAGGAAGYDSDQAAFLNNQNSIINSVNTATYTWLNQGTKSA